MGWVWGWGDGDVIGGAEHLPNLARGEVDPDGTTVRCDIGYLPVHGVAVGKGKGHTFPADKIDPLSITCGFYCRTIFQCAPSPLHHGSNIR